MRAAFLSLILLAISPLAPGATILATPAGGDQRWAAEQTSRSLPSDRRQSEISDVSTPMPGRADGWIALKIRSMLLLRSKLNTATAHVSVRDGVVTLTGSATSIAQKEFIGSYARSVDGVQSVRNEIQVAGSSDATAPSDTVPPPLAIDDATTAAAVNRALIVRAGQGSSTRAEARNGVVILRGNASSTAEKRRITELAEQVPGVSSVVNEMSVSGTE